jgi:hypothetical protein
MESQRLGAEKTVYEALLDVCYALPQGGSPSPEEDCRLYAAAVFRALRSAGYAIVLQDSRKAARQDEAH